MAYANGHSLITAGHQKAPRSPSGIFEATHASYFLRKSSQAAMPIVWALSPVLRASLEASCKQGSDQMKAALSSFGCAF